MVANHHLSAQYWIILASSPNLKQSNSLYLQVVQLFPLHPEILQARVVPVQSHILGIQY